MPKKDVTDGERLCSFLKQQVIDNEVWPMLILALAGSGRDAEWGQFVEERVATQLVGRLVSAGEAFAIELGGKEAIVSREFEQRLRGFITETTRDALSDRPTRDRVLRLTANAVRATWGKVTEADDRILRKEAARPFRCYLCNRRLVMVQGAAVSELGEEEQELAVEYEHIWPRSYGGNTEADNLALACHSCNQLKMQFANWAMVDVQALILGVNPSENALMKITGWRRFALTCSFRDILHVMRPGSVGVRRPR